MSRKPRKKRYIDPVLTGIFLVGLLAAGILLYATLHGAHS